MTFWIIAIVLAAGCVAAFFLLTPRKKTPTAEIPAQPVETRTAEIPVPENPLPQTVDPLTFDQQEEEESPAECDTIQISIHNPNLVLDDIQPGMLEKLRELITALPKLPSVTINVLSILSKPGTGSKEVAKIIERDQSTAARLLRWVNSSLFGLDGNVTSLQRAVTLLGIDTVRSLVLEDSLERNRGFQGIKWLTPKMIWRHVAAVSICAKNLARSVRGADPDVAATAGLLHDIGLILLLITERRNLELIAKECEERHIPPIQGEAEVLGFNHQIIGEVFCRSWGLPEIISTAIGRHHSPMVEPFNPITGIVWLADYICSRIGFECPEGYIPYVNEAEEAEIMSLLGLRHPVEHYITEGLIREMLRSTKYWTSNDSESNRVTIS